MPTSANRSSEAQPHRFFSFNCEMGLESVARYRIGFRGEDGRVIAHIDKRQQAAVAVNR